MGSPGRCNHWSTSTRPNPLPLSSLQAFALTRGCLVREISLQRKRSYFPRQPLWLKCWSLRHPQPKPVEPFPKMPFPRARVGNKGAPQGWISGPGLPFEPISLLSPGDLANGGPHEIKNMYVRTYVPTNMRCCSVRAYAYVRTYARTYVYAMGRDQGIRTYVRTKGLERDSAPHQVPEVLDLLQERGPPFRQRGVYALVRREPTARTWPSHTSP